MGHGTNAIGAILLIIGILGFATGAGLYMYGSLDGEAAKQEFPQDRDRIDQDRQMETAGVSALGMGFGLILIGTVLVARPGVHQEEVSTGMVATRKTFGVLLLILAFILLLVGLGVGITGYNMEAEQDDGFGYDQEEGQMNIAMATAGAILAALGLPLLIASVVMLSKGDEVRESAQRPVDASIEAPAQLKTEEVPAIVEAPVEDSNRTALFALAGTVGILMLFGIFFLAFYGTPGDGGLFGEGRVYEESVYNGTLTNTGNAPIIGTIGSPWEESFVAHDRVQTITFLFETDSTVTLRYTIEWDNNGTWQALASETGSSGVEVIVNQDLGTETIRFRVEPEQSYVQSADIGVLVIEES